MSDSITETDGTQGPRHQGQEQVAPTTKAPATQMLQEVPEAIEQGNLRRRLSGSARQPRLPGSRDVRWVRASDLLSQASGSIAGHGIQLSRAVYRAPHSLRPPARREQDASEALQSDRANRLAPIEAFGARRDTRATTVGLQR
jgi:hypothetical protein